MTDQTVYYGIKECLAKLQNPDKVEKYLHKLSGMGITAAILRETRADKIVSNFFDHPTCGLLARDICCEWMSNAVPSTTQPRRISKRCALSSQWESIMSKIEFDPLVPVKKAKIETSSENQAKLCNENIANIKAASSSLASSIPSSNHRPISSKMNNEAHLKSITARIAQKKAVAQSRHRKTIIFNDSTSLTPSSPSSNSKRTERIIGVKGRPMIKINGASGRK